MKTNTQDLIIIGGGIMGLLSAYFSSEFADNITILEKSTIGNKNSGINAYTRSIRVDYLEPLYAIYAYEAQKLWIELEIQSKKELFAKCGCLNIAKKSITPDFSKTYAEKSFKNIKKLQYKPLAFNKKELNKKYPQFNADMGRLDTKGGYLNVQNILQFLLQEIKKKKITIVQNVEILSIEENNDLVKVATNKNNFQTKKLILTAAKGTNELLEKIKKNTTTFSITYDKPQRKYYYPPKKIADLFQPKNFPVFAYTDVGIYGHPIFDTKKGAVKVAYFVPVGFKRDSSKITCVEDFVNECLPLLKNVPSEEIKDADTCWYDTVVDDDFIIGNLPNFKNIIVGTGFRGTGFKFAPLVGKILSQLALQDGTVYDIKQFSPARFTN